MNEFQEPAHEPTDEFVSSLEWQVRTSLRRQNRFSEPVRQKTGGKMNLVVLVLASALLGAGGVVVKDEVQEARAQQVLLAKASSDLRLATLELDFAVRRFQETETRYGSGVLGEEALLSARVAMLDAENRLARLRLDMEEIQASRKEPLNTVSAPLVGGRDFVSERLALDESAAGERYQHAQVRFQKVQDLEEVGALGSSALVQGMMALQEAGSVLSNIREKLELRERFLAGEVSGEEAERGIELAEIEAEVELLRTAHQEAATRYQEVSERVELGLAPESELERATLDLVQAETRLEFLEVRLVALRGGEGSP